MDENKLIEAEVCQETEDKDVTELVDEVPSDEISSLRAEIDALKSELSKRDELDRAHSRMNTELKEFSEYFPDTELTSIPDEIWERVKNGASLAATYALFLRKSEREQKKIGDFNEKNRRMSAGSLMKGEGERYYSPAEVKKMTPAQVKSNYDDIIASMKHWN
jgi:hypothetical protein